jgi:integrase
VSLSDFFETIYLPLRLIAASAHCVFQYRLNIGRFSAWLGRDAAVADLSDENIARFVGTIISCGKSPATANKVLSQLRALWEFAARRGLRADYPSIRKLQEYRRAPTAWSREQLATLFHALRSVRGRIGGVRASLWWLSLHGVLWDSGARIGALLAAEWSDIDWERGELLLRAEHQKQKADQRFKLHPDTVAMLTLMRHKSGPLFPWPTSRANLWDHYKRILRNAGLPHDRRSKFHRMRRSVASWYEHAGGNATRLLGHSSRKVTEAYLDESITGRPQASELLFRPDPPHDRRRPPGA